MKTNISYVEAKEIILKEVSKKIKTEIIPIEQSLKRCIAEDVFATSSNPSSNNSAMDGYAVRYQDIKNVPVTLSVACTIFAGDLPTTKLKKCEAFEIMTGAIIPEGANAVVPVENTVSKNGSVVILKSVRKGENIRKKGEDYKLKQLLIKKGTEISPAHISLLASMGKKEIKVFHKPTVAILATGSELISLDSNITQGKIYDSNSYGIAAQVEAENCLPYRLGRVEDTPRLIKNAILKGLKKDILIVSGGISMGKADYVKNVLKDLGAKILFSKVRQRPGNPFTFAKIEGKPVFLLPGNPVSVSICFEIYIRPFLKKMTGFKADKEETKKYKIGETIKVKRGRTYFFRVLFKKIDGEKVAFLTGPQGSGIITSLTKAEGILVVPESISEIKEGDYYPITPLSWRKNC